MSYFDYMSKSASGRRAGGLARLANYFAMRKRAGNDAIGYDSEDHGDSEYSKEYYDNLKRQSDFTEGTASDIAMMEATEKAKQQAEQAELEAGGELADKEIEDYQAVTHGDGIPANSPSWRYIDPLLESDRKIKEERDEQEFEDSIKEDELAEIDRADRIAMLKRLGIGAGIGLGAAGAGYGVYRGIKAMSDRSKKKKQQKQSGGDMKRTGGKEEQKKAASYSAIVRLGLRSRARRLR